MHEEESKYTEATVDGADGQDVEDGLDGQSVSDGVFHSTPESPIDRGTIQQAIWSKTQFYLMVTKTFARFSPDFI